MDKHSTDQKKQFSLPSSPLDVQTSETEEVRPPETPLASKTYEYETTALGVKVARPLGSSALISSEASVEVESGMDTPLRFEEIDWVLNIAEYEICARIDERRPQEVPASTSVELVTLRADFRSLMMARAILDPNGLGVFTDNIGKRGEDETHSAYLNRSILANEHFKGVMTDDGMINLSSYSDSRFTDPPRIVAQREMTRKFYEAVQAKQIIEKLEYLPDEVRRTVLETDSPDASWLTSDPVVFKKPED